MVTLEQIQLGLKNYFDNEILIKAVGKDKFKYGFIKGAFMDRVPKIIANYKDNTLIKALEIIDKDNNVNIDEIYKWAKQSIQTSGQFLIGQIIFNESDIDKLYNYIKNTVI